MPEGDARDASGTDSPGVMSGRVRRARDEHVLPGLIERACKSSDILEERKRIIPRAEGRVLEVGVGTGLNLRFYDPDRVREVVGVDVSPPILERARSRVPDARVPVSLLRASAELLPLDAASFDSIVLTYALCSVERPSAAIAEMRRVLRPGGRLYFIEHGVAPDAAVERWQRRITPLWRSVGGNCHLTRDVARELTSRGFDLEESKAGYVGDGMRWLSFTYEGVAH